MNILNSLSTNIKNVFVGSHRGEDFKLEPLPKEPKSNVNDLGVDPYEWFDNPLDRMPIATDNKYHPDPDYIPLPRAAEEEVSDWFAEKPVEKNETIHEKVYKIATSKYNPFAVGGSESIHDFEGGSENVQKL